MLVRLLVVLVVALDPIPPLPSNAILNLQTTTTPHQSSQLLLSCSPMASPGTNMQEDKDSRKHRYNLTMMQEELFHIFCNEAKARICSLCMNKLTVMHAYDEFGVDGDEVKRCEVICDSVSKHRLIRGSNRRRLLE